MKRGGRENNTDPVGAGLGGPGGKAQIIRHARAQRDVDKDARIGKVGHVRGADVEAVFSTFVALISQGDAGAVPAVRRLLLTGKSEKVVAEELYISPHTVHSHVKQIYKHFGVSSRAELMASFIDRAVTETS